MKFINLVFICFILLFLSACSGNSKPSHIIKIGQVTLKTTEAVVIAQKSFVGYMPGADLKNDEVYVRDLMPQNNQYVIRIIDAGRLIEKKVIHLPKGNIDSPSHFSEPGFMQSLNGLSLFVDGYNKIVAFDSRFKRLFSTISNHPRVFVDFFKRQDDMFYIIGIKNSLKKEVRHTIKIFELKSKGRPEFVSELHRYSQEAEYSKNGRKFYHVGYFWPSTWGFEKDGFIFYSNSSNANYHRYDLSTGKTDAFELSYLNLKEYSIDDAEEISRYKDTGWAKKMRRKVVYIPSTSGVYHFGLFDVGIGKIGIVGAMDTNKMQFRLDILDSKTGEYSNSILLPFGEGFLRRISTEYLGYLNSYIDLENGIYAWSDLDDETLDNTVRVTRFKVE